MRPGIQGRHGLFRAGLIEELEHLAVKLRDGGRISSPPRRCRREGPVASLEGLQRLAQALQPVLADLHRRLGERRPRSGRQHRNAVVYPDAEIVKKPLGAADGEHDILAQKPGKQSNISADSASEDGIKVSGHLSPLR